MRDLLPRGILDTVSSQEQSAALRAFNFSSLIGELLEQLKPREKRIILARYGLEDGHPHTLETIGKNLNLTRERVRQIEKESLQVLNQIGFPSSFSQAIDVIFQIIEDQGNISRGTKVFEIILVNNNSEVARRSVSFILHLVPRFTLLKESEIYHQSWYVTGFDMELFQQVGELISQLLKDSEKPVTREVLFSAIRQNPHNPEIQNLSDEALESYVSVHKAVAKNPFGEWGLTEWPSIDPKDVGDKAYLVLLHHGKPEHYSKITEMINKQKFDDRIAHKETVHNELIRDERFVLVGRGIYALRQWGYKKGVVAEIVQDILRAAGRSLSREEIISEVQKQRLVKRNTIIVGLANRKLFRKNEDNKYLNV